MKLNHPVLTLTAGALFANALPSGSSSESRGHDAPPCRFALKWSQEQVLEHTDDFVSDLLYWEGKFHQNDIAYNAENGMSYDGSQIDWVTGENTKKHTFSAASKEVSLDAYYCCAELKTIRRLCKLCCTPAPLTDLQKQLSL
jgi:hypothetical protein